MSLLPREYLRHILDEIDYMLTQISNTDFDSFLKDATLKRAFVRSLEIIAEQRPGVRSSFLTINIGK